MINKKSVMTALVSLGVVLSSGNANAEQAATSVDAYFAPIHFEFDGKHLLPLDGQQAFLYEESTYVPLRFIAYSLNKAVDWDPDTYTVTVREPNNIEKVTIKEYRLNREVKDVVKDKVDTSKLSPTSIPVYFDQVQYVFDGEKKEPPEHLPGLIYQDSLYVPMRFMSEALGKKIAWDPDTYTVISSSTGNSEETSPEVKPNPSTNPIGTPGTGGTGAVTPAKPSLTSLVFNKGLELASMQSSAESTLRGYEASYKAATTDEKRAEIKSQAESFVAQVRSNFYSNMDAYESTLKGYGYETSSVDMYKSAFEQKVSDGRASVGQ